MNEDSSLFFMNTSLSAFLISVYIYTFSNGILSCVEI